RVGYPISWTDLQNVQITANNSIFKHTGGGTWSGAALSRNKLLPSTDGWIEFSAPSIGAWMMVGLARQNSIPGYNSIDYGFYFDKGIISIRESGIDRGFTQYQRAGDLYAIDREGDQVKYYINNVLVRSVTVNPTH